MTPEGRVKAQVKKVLEAAGAWYFMPVSNGMGRHGIPDFIACHKGEFLAIETKAGKGRTTALQQRELDRIEAIGGRALVVTDDPTTMQALEAVLANMGTI